MRSAWIVVAALAAAVLETQAAGASAAVEARSIGPAALQAGQRKQRSHPKLDAALAEMAQGTVPGLAKRGSQAAPLGALGARVNSDDEVQVYVRTLPYDAAAAVLAAAAGLRVEVALAEPGIVQGWIAADRLAALAGQAWVRRVTLPRYVAQRIGSVLTEGDAVHRANELRALGVTGSGVRVGVISDGVESLAAAQASGDLPASVTVLGGCDSGDAGDGDCDEGTAMLEIIHDLAPGAILGFCGPQTSVEFIQCAQRLRGSEFNADIIVDDLGFPAEPYLEDGPVALDAAAAVAAGVLWASSAGNDGSTARRLSYSADYLAAPITDQFYDSLHDFGLAAGTASDAGNPIQLPPGATASVILQWSDPFGASANDYDLFLLDAAQQAVAASVEPQDGNDDPIEVVQFENTSGAGQSLRIVVARLQGAQNRRLRLFACFDLADDCQLFYFTPGGEIYGHPAVPGVIAVAAIDARDPGADDIEPFSSQGPVDIFVPTFERRQKPDIAAVDGVRVTGAGGFPSRFFGTSAASPHIGGLLALLLSGFDGDAQTALLGTAVDLGAAGRDTAFGAGRADVMAAARTLNRKPTAQIVSPATDVAIVAGDSVTFAGQCADPENQGGIAFAWSFGNSGLAASTQQNPGPQQFANAGTFTVSFTCIDTWGVSDTTSRTITVAAPAGGGGGSGAWSPGWLIVPALAALVALRRKTRAA